MSKSQSIEERAKEKTKQWNLKEMPLKTDIRFTIKFNIVQNIIIQQDKKI